MFINIKNYIISLVSPLTKTISKTEYFLILVFQLVCVYYFWSTTENPLIPKITDVFNSIFNYLSNSHFYDCLFNSLFLTVKAMVYSLLCSMIISYLFFFRITRNISLFITTCRYLSYTGLIYIFLFILKDISELKISLLMFGIIPFFTTSLISIYNTIKPEVFNLATSLRMNRWQTLYEVVINGQKDQLIQTLGINFAISWMMIAMVESQSMSVSGLGNELVKESKQLRLHNVFALMTIIYVLGLLIDFLFKKLVIFLFPYKIK